MESKWFARIVIRSYPLTVNYRFSINKISKPVV